MFEKLEADLLESCLIVDRQRQRVEIRSALFLDPVADHADPGLRSIGHRLARQPFAQQERKCALDRNLVRRLRAADGIAAHPHVERGIEIVADAVIALGAQRFVAHHFHGVVARACGRLGRRVAGMEGFVVMPDLERHRVGKAARFGDLIGRQRTARHRHAEILARLAWRVRSEGKLDLRLVRKRARCTRQDGLEAVKGGLIGHGNTSLKQGRWSGRPQSRCIIAANASSSRGRTAFEVLMRSRPAAGHCIERRAALKAAVSDAGL